jgi:hypothetical protein
MATSRRLIIYLNISSIFSLVIFFSVAHSLDSSDMRSLAIPPPDDIKEDMVVPNDTPNPFTFEFSKVAPVRKPGGTVKIVDTRTFKVSQKISAAEVELDVGGLRYLISFALGHDCFLIGVAYHQRVTCQKPFQVFWHD